MRPFWALRNINLSVGKGERLGLIGRNGAGKSTLLKLICGNLQATEGCMSVNGQIQAMMEMGTAFHPDFTGRQNVRASLAYQGFSSARIKECEDEIEDFVELGPFFDQPVKAYSAGMYARLAFAAATSVKPEILIIDEVLGAGDAYFANKCAARMKRLTHDSGATLLFVSHDISAVQQMCDRAVWIERGQIIMDDTPLDVGKAYYAETLRLEEERLRIQNQKAMGGSLVEAQPDVLVFRFVREDCGVLQSAHPIRRLSLKSASGDYELTVRPGAPMDNDNAQSASIILTPGSLWGEPEAAEGGEYARPVAATGGADNQAAFQFVAHGLSDRDDLRLEVEYAPNAEERLAVEYYTGQEYVRLGVLEAEDTGAAWHTRKLTLNSTPDEELESSRPLEKSAVTVTEAWATEQESERFRRIQESRDKFSSNFAQFTNISLGEAAAEQVVFKINEDIRIQIKVTVLKAIEGGFLTMAINSYTDERVFANFWPLPVLNPGDHEIELVLKKPNLRHGEYIAGFTLIDREPKLHEEVLFYCEWNRTHHFIIDEGILESIPLGLIKLDTELCTREITKCPPFPSVIYITINNCCNLFCKTCDVGQKNKNSQFYNIMTKRGKRQLDLPILYSFIQQVKEFKPLIAIVGTEPLLFKDLWDFIKIARQADLPVQLTTNGLLLPKLARQTVDSGVTSLWLSLDGPAHIHNELRGHSKSFELAIEGMKRVAQLAEEEGKQIELCINYTICSDNDSCLTEFLDEIVNQNLPITTVTFSHFNFVTSQMAEAHNKLYGKFLPATASSVCSLQPISVNVDSLQAEIEKIKATNWGFPIGFAPDVEGDRLYDFYYNHNKVISKKMCSAPFDMAQLQSNGDCVIAARCFDHALGNIFESSFAEIWCGEKYQQARVWAKQGLAPGCTRCCGAL